MREILIEKKMPMPTLLYMWIELLPEVSGEEMVAEVMHDDFRKLVQDFGSGLLTRREGMTQQIPSDSPSFSEEILH